MDEDDRDSIKVLVQKSEQIGFEDESDHPSHKGQQHGRLLQPKAQIPEANRQPAQEDKEAHERDRCNDEPVVGSGHRELLVLPLQPKLLRRALHHFPQRGKGGLGLVEDMFAKQLRDRSVRRQHVRPHRLSHRLHVLLHLLGLGHLLHRRHRLVDRALEGVEGGLNGPLCHRNPLFMRTVADAVLRFRDFGLEFGFLLAKLDHQLLSLSLLLELGLESVALFLQFPLLGAVRLFRLLNL
mmetsp:Transcript_2359/g.6317  ORF Transcript_2359/g.6317 Transcript_2359/m.6317 type:complete len:239 (+) Transcript_2359:340-1056(+)